MMTKPMGETSFEVVDQMAWAAHRKLTGYACDLWTCEICHPCNHLGGGGGGGVE